MDIIFKRPLVVFCISLLIGIITADITNSVLFTVALVLLISAVLVALAGKFRGRLFICIGIVLFLSIGSIEYLWINQSISDRFVRYNGSFCEITGYLASEADITETRVSWLVEVTSITTEGNRFTEHGKLMLSAMNGPDTPLLEYGKEIFFSGKLNLPSGIRNPGGFDYRKYLARKGASAVVFAQNGSIKPGKGRKASFAVSAGLRVRNSIAGVIEKSLPRQQAGLLNGMLIGYTEGLSDKVKDAFSNAGLSHIMAVSGANVLFIIIPVQFLLERMRLGKRASNVAIIIFLIFFVYITGFEPSVLRAVTMAVTILAGQIIRRDSDIYTSMALSAILLLLYSPHMLFNIGFQLSYAATLSLVLFGKPIKTLITCRFIPEKVAEVLAATLAAQAGVLPVTAVYFNKLSVISLVSNMLVVPFLEGITILGMAMAVLGHIYIGFSRIIGYLNCGLLSFVLYVTGITSSFPYSTVKIATPGLPIILMYYAALWFFLLYRPGRNITIKPAYLAVAGAIMLVVVLGPTVLPGKLEVVFLDVGEGDCALVKTGSGRTVLIDGGGKAGENGDRVGEAVVLPFLLDRGITGLDLVVATHGHDDHTKGLEVIVRELGVKALCIPDIAQKDEFSVLNGIAQEKGIKVITCARGEKITLDGNTFLEVLSPASKQSYDKSAFNESSIVLKLLYGKTSILFTGDIGTPTEMQLIGQGADLKADVLKIAHHGSEFSTSSEFLEAVEPEAAVISVGTNHFGHPGKAVLERLAGAGIEILRTDTDGGVVLTSDGSKIRMHGTVQKEREKPDEP